MVNTLSILFLSYISVLIGRFLFETDRISIDMVLASICLYLLIGLLWAFIYQLIEVNHSGAFRFTSLDSFPLDPRSMRREFIYYSYVTISTLGYGDITPVTRIARSWAVLETLTGQIYIAVVIARLVGLYISSPRKHENK